ncbi:MAG: hypothetical protein ACPGVT_03490 [Maricaulaceae bacterium]
MGSSNKLFKHVGVYAFILLIGIIYYVLRPNMHNEGEDTLVYAFNVMGRGTGWVNPHHILFEYFHMVFYKLALALGYAGKSLLIMQIVTIVTSVISFILMYEISKKLKFSTFYSILCIGCTAFSFGIWAYGAEADTYLPPLALALLAILFFINSFMQPNRRKTMILLGFVCGLATLMHQQYVLLVGIVGLSILTGGVFIDRRDNFLKTFIDAIIFGIAAAITIGIGYFYISFLVLEHQSIGETISWARGLTKGGTWEALSWWKTPVMGTIALARTFWGLLYVYAHPQLMEILSSLLKGQNILEETFAVRNDISLMLVYLLTFLSGIGTLAGAYLVFKLIFGWKNRLEIVSGEDSNRKLAFIHIALLYIFVFSFATLIWEASNTEFWLHIVPVCFLLFFYLLQRLPAQKSFSIAASLLMGTLFITNLFGAIFVYTNNDNDYWAYANKGILETLKKGDVLLVACGYTCDAHLKYHTEAKVLELSMQEPEKTRIVIENAIYENADRIFLSKWLIEPSEQYPYPSMQNTFISEFKMLHEKIKDDLVDVPFNINSVDPAWDVHEIWEYKR